MNLLNRLLLRREMLAGLTTFLTMAYIIFVNPNLLSIAGMNYGAVFVATCLASALGCFLMGCLTDYPIAVAPGMALNVYFTYVIVKGMGFAWQDALGAVFIAGVLFLIISVTALRRYIVESIPSVLNIAITIGLGLFIALIAFRNIGITFTGNGIAALPAHFWLQLLLFFTGVLVIVACTYYGVPGAILLGILSTTLLGLLFGLAHYHGIFSLPPSVMPTFLHFHMENLFNLKGLAVIFSFLFVTLFDCTGTLLGLLEDAKGFRKTHFKKRVARGLLADSVATVAGSVLGTSSTSPYLESATGMRAGGRTGLTAITVAGLFLLALFLSPLAATIPAFATAPALLFVGCLMAKNLGRVNWRDASESVPSLLVILVIPYTLSIANGVGAGIISYTVLKMLRRQWRSINPTLLVLSGLFILYFSMQLTVMRG